jgi:RecA-family ATPase
MTEQEAAEKRAREKYGIPESEDAGADTEGEQDANQEPLRPMPSWIDYGDMQVDRSKYHIGEGFLEVGSIVMLIGPSYIGKSTFLAQLSIYFAIGRSWLFFLVERPMRILVVQAEDSNNKLIKMGQMYRRMGLTETEIALARENIGVLTIRDLQDGGAIAEIERHALALRPDIICVNPLTSYMSKGVYRDDEINTFLRVRLTPMLDRLGVSSLVIHHPPKPPTGANNREPRDLTAFEIQYGAAGMAALTNVSRGNIFLTHVDGEVFKLNAGKGFDDLGVKQIEAYLKRSRDASGVMLWEECSQTQATEAVEKEETRRAKRGKSKVIVYDNLLKALSPTEKYSRDKLIELAKLKLNKGRDWAGAAMSQLVLEKKLAKSEQKNPKGQSLVFYHLPTVLEPATGDEDSSDD